MMGVCTKRRIYILFLIIAILQIVTIGIRQIFDFFGPLWALIFTNFLSIVFSIFGFFGGYTRRRHYLISYIIWSLSWCAWNIFIICLYIPIPSVENYKSAILSLGTGGFSWWETRAPGCIPDWASETKLLVTNCLIDPNFIECLQAGIQAFLSIMGLGIAICLVISPYKYEEKPSSKNGSVSSTLTKRSGNSVPSFLSLSRNNNNSGSNHTSSMNRASSRTGSRGQTSDNTNTDGGGGTSNITSIEDKLRPMTPRRVKRRSARSIQSSKFGPQQGSSSQNTGDYSNPRPGSSGTSSNRNSLRSNASTKRNSHRNSKRKVNHFVSPVNRFMQQLDSETSEQQDDPRRSIFIKDKGHINPVYLGPQSPPNPPNPPRPPSARSSYSNYHPARLPFNLAPNNQNPNVLNLNQSIFTNQAFDMSPEYNSQYNTSQLSNTTFYEDEIQFHPGGSSNMSNNTTSIHHHNHNQNHIQMNHPVPKPPPMPRPPVVNFSPTSQNLTFLHQPLQPPHQFNQQQKPQSQPQPMQQQQQKPKSILASPSQRSPLNPNIVAYPLAHSPVSQDSFPMWGIAQAQVPISPTKQHQPANTNAHNSNHNYNNNNNNRLYRVANGVPPNLRPFTRQPINSETVI